MNSSGTIAEKIGRILYVTRKQCGLSQTEIAKSLDLGQSAYSRIETGTQVLTTSQWFQFCDATAVLPDSIRTGYVEFLRQASTKNDRYEGYFKVPAKFARHRGSTVRSMLPFLSHLKASFGSEKSTEYLKALKFDPDFFLDLNNQVNLNFCLTLSRTLIEKGALKKDGLDALTRSINLPDLHGHLRYRYDGILSPLDLLNSLIFNARYYECNFAYEIADRSKGFMDISISPEKHIEDFDYRDDPVLGDFLCQYKQSYFKQFASYGGVHNSTVTELECHYKKHRTDRCVYRVHA